MSVRRGVRLEPVVLVLGVLSDRKDRIIRVVVSLFVLYNYTYKIQEGRPDVSLPIITSSSSINKKGQRDSEVCSAR